MDGIISKLFRDKHGHLVIWQFPNPPLWGWILSSVVGKLLPAGTIQHASTQLAQLFLFTWSYLEIRAGESLFRRVLGVIVAGFIVFSLFSS